VSRAAIAGFGNERAIARTLGLAPALVERASRRLERERLIVRDSRIDGYAGAHAILREFID
jgi:hypothetical protein